MTRQTAVALGVPEASVAGLRTQWAADIEASKPPPERDTPSTPVMDAADRVLAEIGRGTRPTPAPPPPNRADPPPDRTDPQPEPPVAASAEVSTVDEDALRKLASQSLRGADEDTRALVRQARRQAKAMGIEYTTRKRPGKRRRRRRTSGEHGDLER